MLRLKTTKTSLYRLVAVERRRLERDGDNGGPSPTT